MLRMLQRELSRRRHRRGRHVAVAVAVFVTGPAGTVVAPEHGQGGESLVALRQVVREVVHVLLHVRARRCVSHAMVVVWALLVTAVRRM